MILHWEQLVLYYGKPLSLHQSKFEKATQTTFGLLACRYSPTDFLITSSAGDHAEQRLLKSDIWSSHLPIAVARSETTNQPLVTAIVINRSPCQSCANLLILALDELFRRNPLRTGHNRFILAALGAYEDGEMQNMTTQNDLVRLQAAGWELAVLQTGSSLSRRGLILQQGIERIAGSGYLRLSA